MTTEQLRVVLHAEPFRPFTIRLANGRYYHVPHPDFVAHRPGGRIAMVMREDVDAGEYVDLLLVVGLELDSQTGNGGRGRKRKGEGR